MLKMIHSTYWYPTAGKATEKICIKIISSRENAAKNANLVREKCGFLSRVDMETEPVCELVSTICFVCICIKYTFFSIKELVWCCIFKEWQARKKGIMKKSCTRMKNRLSNHSFSVRHPRSTAPSDEHKARYSNDDLGMKIRTTERRAAKKEFLHYNFSNATFSHLFRDVKRSPRVHNDRWAVTKLSLLHDADETRQ